MINTEQKDRIVWYFNALTSQKRAYAIYGAGKYTGQLMIYLHQQTGVRLPEFIFDDKPLAERMGGVPLIDTASAMPESVHEIILGSDTYQLQMRDRLEGLWASRCPVMTDLDKLPELPAAMASEPLPAFAEFFALLAKGRPLSWQRFVPAFRLLLKYAPWTRPRFRGGFHRASVIVLTFNNLDITRKSSESFVRNTYFPYELIIVDNGSSTETLAWLEDFVATHDRVDRPVKMIKRRPDSDWPRRKKIYSAKNAALRLATGDPIVVSDSDILYSPFWLYFAVGVLSRWPDKAGIVGLQRYPGWTTFVYDSFYSGGFVVDSVNTVEGCNLVFTRATFEKIGFFKEGDQNYDYPFENYHGCDVEYTYRLKEHGLLNLVPKTDLIVHMRQPHKYSTNEKRTLR